MKTKKCKICGKKLTRQKLYCSNKCKFKDKQYNISRGIKKEVNDKNLAVECKLCKWTTSDYLNLSGVLSRHFKEKHNIEYSEKNVKCIKNKKNLRPFFNCPICDFKIYDVENKGGGFSLHIQRTHNMNTNDFVKLYPKHANLCKKQIDLKNRTTFLSNPSNNIICKICNKKFKMLTNSHLKLHNITQEQYKLKYGVNLISKTTGDILKENCINNEAFQGPIRKSKYETEIEDFIKSLNITNIITSDRKTIFPQELDIYIPDYKCAIEFDGLVWHSEFFGKKDKNYHLNKTDKCMSNDIKLIHIFEDEWVNKKPLIENKIKMLLNCFDSKKVFARKCKVKEIESSEKSEFLNKYHIQGDDKSSIKLGLYYEDILISVMTFGSVRVALGNKKSNKNEYELVRYATNFDYHSIGGAGKLLSYFIKKYNPSKISTFADLRFTYPTDNLYTKLGFNFISKTKPNYYYIGNGLKRLHRYNFTKHRLVSKYGADKSKSETQIMKDMGYDRIWDCGNLKYELSI